MNVGLILFDNSKLRVMIKHHPTNDDFKNDCFQSLKEGLEKKDVGTLYKEICIMANYNHGFMGIDLPKEIAFNNTLENFDQLFEELVLESEEIFNDF